MRKNIFFKILSSLVLIHCLAVSYSQSFVTSDSLNKRVIKLHQLYQDVLRSDPHLYNGIEYVEYSRNTEGHPFYLTNNWTNGIVLYSNQTYENVPLLYDILKDKLVIENPLAGNSIQLVDENIKSFSLGIRKFMRIKENDSTHLQKGFYEILYDGGTKVLVKRKKSILEKALSGDYKITLEESARIYILKDKLALELNSKKKLKSILKDKKKEVNQFIRKNHINFWEDFETAIVSTLVFYDGLKSQ